MIDWPKTAELYGISEPKYRKRLAMICDVCGGSGSIILKRVSDVINRQMPWRCPKCRYKAASAKLQKAYADPEVRAAISKASKKKWQDPEYRNKVLASLATSREQAAAKQSDTMRKRWADPEFRNKWVASLNTNETKAKLSNAAKAKWEDPEYKASMIELFKARSVRLWQDKAYRDKITASLRDSRQQSSKLLKARWRDPEYRQKMADIHRRLWAQPEYRARMMRAITRNSNTPEFRARMKAMSLACWQNPEYRDNQIKKLSARMTARWKDPAFRAKMETMWANPGFKEKMALIRAKQPRISSLQATLYSILDDLEVKYFKEHEDKGADPECVIGPYTFDCVIPRNNGPDLLIECQGEYWHSLKGCATRDKAKASYITTNFSNKYELKYIWEHEFYNHNKVVELLKYWLDIEDVKAVEFDFAQIAIKPCPAKDYKLLLSKYHYLPSAGRGGIAYGAYLENKLTAVCIFSPLVRQNIQIDNFASGEVRELSRLCIHPGYRKKNFASWFVGRCIRRLDPQYKCIISYCDTTFNHDGATYKACNFIQDSEVRPDYWYVSEDGWIMHKRTLYGRAVNMKMKEKEYAELMGYARVYGSKKLRFKFVR